MQAERGFTIVELLIVIVVIGILAAITIVAYNGVTARANTTNAKAAAALVLKKSEAFYAEKGAYPLIPSDLTGATAVGTSYQLASTTFNTAGTSGTAPAATAPAKPSVVNFFACTAGQRIDYWDYTVSNWASLYSASATSVNCPSTAYVHA